MVKILFQGDSITDAGRNRSNPQDLGSGYPAFVASKLGLDQPGEYEFHNRGIGGDRIVDVYARIKLDIINIKPDYMSLLIGVNDVWHELTVQNGVDTLKFRKIYRMLLEEVKEALPDIVIILIEPFVLSGSLTQQYYDLLTKGIKEKAEVVRELAEEFHLPCISLQEDLKYMADKVSPEYWLLDGVHPSIYFHQHIAEKWMDQFRTISYGKDGLL